MALGALLTRGGRRNGAGSRFAAKYGGKTPVWYEHYGDVKLRLIERFNPEWRVLYETLNT